MGESGRRAASLSSAISIGWRENLPPTLRRSPLPGRVAEGKSLERFKRRFGRFIRPQSYGESPFAFFGPYGHGAAFPVHGAGFAFAHGQIQHDIRVGEILRFKSARKARYGERVRHGKAFGVDVGGNFLFFAVIGEFCVEPRLAAGKRDIDKRGKGFLINNMRLRLALYSGGDILCSGRSHGFNVRRNVRAREFESKIGKVGRQRAARILPGVNAGAESHGTGGAFFRRGGGCGLYDFFRFQTGFALNGRVDAAENRSGMVQRLAGKGKREYRRVESAGNVRFRGEGARGSGKKRREVGNGGGKRGISRIGPRVESRLAGCADNARAKVSIFRAYIFFRLCRQLSTRGWGRVFFADPPCPNAYFSRQGRH
jgi:hypothetical protein